MCDVNKQRCAHPDEFVIAGRWDKPFVTFWLGDVLGPLKVFSRLWQFWMTRQAIKTWERAAEGRIRFGFRMWPRADIWVGFVKREHGDPWPFRTANILAHAFIPSPAYEDDLEGDVHMNELVDWRQVDPRTVMIHEVGHAIGLGHSNVAGSIMNPYYRGTQHELGNDDVAAVRRAYR